MIRARMLVLAASLVGLSTFGWADSTLTKTTAIARMKSDLQFLTSDECEGRGPGTEGINKAADFIAAAFKNAGLKPGGKDGGYFQPFQVRGAPKPPIVAMTLRGPNDLNIKIAADDYSALGMTGSGKASGDIVFIGHSIANEKAEYDDFKDLDINGKIVLMLRRSPRYTGDKRFADDETMQAVVSLAKKVENAEKRGAAAVLLVNDRSTLADSGDIMAPFSSGAFGSPAKIPALHLRRDLGELIVRKALGKTLEQLEKEIDKDLKPQNGVLKGWTADVDVAIDRNRMIDVKNVVGVLEGSGPLAEEIVIIGAHYDHLGYGGRDSLARGSKAIHYGADDNASGTTSVIELARRFGGMKDRVGRKIVFMTFSAEEMGLLGSAHYCKEPLFPLEKTVAMINLDMVGRCALDKDDNLEKMEIGGVGTAKSFEEMIDRHNKKYNFKLKKTKTGMGPSDHQSFYMKKLPVLFFFTGLHTDYHRPSDTWDKINLDSMAKIVDMVEDVAKEVTSQETPLEFVQVAAPQRNPGEKGVRPNVTLGIMPDYNDEGEGLLLSGVTPDGPAAKAGLKEGDRILSIGGQPVKNITAYMAEMRKAERGKPVEVIYERKKEKITVQVTPQ
jgi:hypothetical protein